MRPSVKIQDPTIQKVVDDIYKELNSMPKNDKNGKINVTNHKNLTSINVYSITLEDLANAFGTLVERLKSTGIIQ